MSFDKYKNILKYPSKSDFVVTYYYRQGKLISEINIIGGDITGTVKEVTINNDAYKLAIKEYKIEELRLYQLFKQDLFEELGIEHNSKREKLFELAWERGHSSGYESVYSEANELVDLIL